MTKEEALQILSTRDAHGVMCGYTSGVTEALDIAVEALKAYALLEQEIDFHKEVSRIEAEKVVDLEHKLADMVSVVRCKDCIYADFKSPYPVCNFLEMNINEDSYCSWGEREEE